MRLDGKHLVAENADDVARIQAALAACDKDKDAPFVIDGFDLSQIADASGRLQFGCNFSPLSNAGRSALETYWFLHDYGARKFGYLSDVREGNGNGIPTQATFGTWTGQTLGAATLGRVQRGLMGKWRTVNVRAINGLTYYGRHFVNAGDYVKLRLRASK
jgi:hypothetical protein